MSNLDYTQVRSSKFITRSEVNDPKFNANKLQGTDIESPLVPSAGNVLVWDSSTDEWVSGSASESLCDSQGNLIIGPTGTVSATANRNVYLGCETGPATFEASDNVVIGYQASQEEIGVSAGDRVAIGSQAAQTNQGNESIAIGKDAGSQSQGTNSVAIGSGSGQTSQGSFCVALGNSAGNGSQSEGAVAIGSGAGNQFQSDDAVAIGPDAGQTFQGNAAIAIGAESGRITQGASAVAIGLNSGQTNQGVKSVAIGDSAGAFTQGSSSVAIGDGAGQIDQGISSIAIGFNAGQNTQSNGGVAIGSSCAVNQQGPNAVAIGSSSAGTGQGISAVAIGNTAGSVNQGNDAISIGSSAGATSQGANSIAIGSSAGAISQGANSIAIGNNAFVTNQTAGSIYLNATGVAAPASVPRAGFFVSPIRTVTGTRTTRGLGIDVDNAFEVVQYTTKSFVIDHPTDADKHLVHVCLEGPEVGVYYRGKSCIEKKCVEICLPEYADKLASEFTIQLTVKYQNGLSNKRELCATDVNNGKFMVYGNPGPFFYLVHGKRADVEVEPLKKDVNLKGDGPYTYLEKKLGVNEL